MLVKIIGIFSWQFSKLWYNIIVKRKGMDIMPNYLNDGRSYEKQYDDYRYDYDFHESWYDVESAFCEQMEIEPEIYDD